MIDVVCVLVVVTFAWSGTRFGMVDMLTRLIGVLGMLLLVLLLIDPVARLLRAMFSSSLDVADTLAVIIVGIFGYVLSTRLAGWWIEQRDFESVEAFQESIAAVVGAAVGIMWSLGMVIVLIMMTSSNVFTRSAIGSRVGTAVIDHGQGTLRWVNHRFPHSTQTMPKGTSGVVTGSITSLPIRSISNTNGRPADADELMGSINGYRKDHDRELLVWNIDLAELAIKQSKAMFRDGFLDTRSSSGRPLDELVKDALGGSADQYFTFDAHVAWAHSIPNAFAEFVGEKGISDSLLDRSFTEIGIGVADAGWFNGKMITVTLAGRTPISGTSIPHQQSGEQ